MSPGNGSEAPAKEPRPNADAAKLYVVPVDGDTATPDRAPTPRLATSGLSPYDRRIVLAIRTLKRWRQTAVWWPPTATSWDEADGDWTVDVVATYFAVALAGAA